MKPTHIVSMPSYNIIWAVVLSTPEELSPKLVNNFPRLLSHLILSNRAQKVPPICKTIRTKGSQLREFKLRTPDLQDIPTRGTIWKIDAKADTALDNNNLTWLHKDGTEFSLNVECSLLWNNEKFTVGVNKCLLLHACVGDVDMCGQTFAQCGITRAGNTL